MVVRRCGGAVCPFVCTCLLYFSLLVRRLFRRHWVTIEQVALCSRSHGTESYLRLGSDLQVLQIVGIDLDGLLPGHIEGLLLYEGVLDTLGAGGLLEDGPVVDGALTHLGDLGIGWIDARGCGSLKSLTWLCCNFRLPLTA